MSRITIEQLIGDPPRLHRDVDGTPVSWGLSEDGLRYLADNVHPGDLTLETGAGVSTILMLFRGAQHIAIAPSDEEERRIGQYCGEHGIDREGLTFHAASSEALLPHLELPELDLILIDGGHSFPLPFIDFHYTHRRLRVGGKLMVDDTQIWTGDVLTKFLQAQPGWRQVADFMTTSVFEKTAVVPPGNDWVAQPFVVRQSATNNPGGGGWWPKYVRSLLEEPKE